MLYKVNGQCQLFAYEQISLDWLPIMASDEDFNFHARYYACVDFLMCSNWRRHIPIWQLTREQTMYITNLTKSVFSS